MYGAVVLEPRRRRQSSRWVRVAFACVAASLLVVQGRRRSVGTYFFEGSAVVDEDDEAITLGVEAWEQKVCGGAGVCVVASNEYERSLGRAIMNGKQEELGAIVVEVFEPTVLRVAGATSCSLEVEEPLVVVEGDGCTLIVEAATAGETSGRVVGHFSFLVLTRYVRRELRDLSASDRENYLGAMHVLWDLDDEAGAARYGDKFKSTASLTRTHLYHSANKECDSWHGGPSFYVVHAAFTTAFEQSIQSVDARVCAHYWDHTIDAASGAGWVESPVFADSFFGSVHPNNTAHVVDSGRWAYTKLYAKAWSYSRITNAYGLLMAPWNTIKTPFVTRAQQLWGWPHDKGGMVDCFKVETTVKTYSSSLSEMMEPTEVNLHSKIHGFVGGAWNYLPEMKAREQRLYDAMGKQGTSYWLEVHKELWRLGAVHCPTYCAEDVLESNCDCVLNPYFANYTAYHVLKYAHLIETYLSNVTNTGTNDTIWNDVLDQGVNGGHQGTMLNDGSPSDPVFWIIHQMQDRLISALRWYADTSTLVFGQEFGDSLSQNLFNWTGVDGPPFLARVDWSKSYSCPGQGVNDLQPFKNLLRNTRSSTHTNAEYYNMTAPFSNHTTFVYDQLTNFSQCGDVVKNNGLFL
ncbi:hypothetical protein CTAYLR_005535 [Chrysophaeum taylorii]|uniref:Tyrosinase copper-binding domain-containing protein n=1 Tax=Chrysophaeum taylorii TaxID=2483200 RepID=A0AAD7U4P1_9STRA|nr:hypothetical protein CTAYLR_005535 [Chrysophaeum taylorii]